MGSAVSPSIYNLVPNSMEQSESSRKTTALSASCVIETGTSTPLSTLSSSTNLVQYNFAPIVIETVGIKTITFYVLQSWKVEEKVKWIATDRTAPDDSTSNQRICTKEDDVTNNQVFRYTAGCINGISQVTLYVHDDTFLQGENVSLPSRCEALSNVGSIAYYKFDIPCKGTTVQTKLAACGSTPLESESTSQTKCINDTVITDENFDVNDNSWSSMTTSTFGTYGKFLGRFGKENPESSKIFFIPQNADYIIV